MRTKPQPFSVLVVVAALLFSTLTVMAQQQMNNWSRVTALASGARLSVKLKTGKTLKGTLNSASDTGLSLQVKNSAVDVKREDVATVHEVVKKSSAMKATRSEERRVGKEWRSRGSPYH